MPSRTSQKEAWATQKCRCFDVFWGGFSFYQSGWKIKMGINKQINPGTKSLLIFLWVWLFVIFEHLETPNHWNKNMCWKEFPYHNVTYSLVTSNEIVVACRNTYCWELHIQNSMRMNGDCIWRHQHWSSQLIEFVSRHIERSAKINIRTHIIT